MFTMLVPYCLQLSCIPRAPVQGVPAQGAPYRAGVLQGPAG